MALSSETVKLQFAGDGATISFAVTFIFWDLDDLQVVHRDSAGTETIWVRGTQYDVTGGEGATGTIEVDIDPVDYTPASGETLTVTSNLSDLQDLSLPEGGPFPSNAVEQRFDKNVRLIQQKEEELSRAMKFPVSDPSSAVGDIPAVASRKGKTLGFNSSTGAPQVIEPTNSSPNSVTATGSTTARTLADLFGTAGDLTFNIPTNFNTLQAAIDELSTLIMREGHRIILNIETGHAITDGISVANGDYRHFKITADDATVLLAAGYPVESDVVYGHRADMPELACLIDGGGTKGSNGYYAENNSRGVVASGAGVRNLGGTGTGNTGVGLFVVANSEVYAESSVFTGNDRNIWASQNCRVQAENATLSGSTGDMNVLITRASLGYLTGADMTNAAAIALAVHRSYCAVNGTSGGSAADLSDAGTDGLFAVDCAIVAAEGVTINDSGSNAIAATQLAQVDATSVTVAGTSGPGQQGIRASFGGRVNAQSATITGAGGRGIYATEGSMVSARGASVTGSTLEDLLVESGGQIVCHTTTTSTAGDKPNLADVGGATAFNVASEFGIIWSNGWVARNRGNGTITSGNTSVVITHGLSGTPVGAEISINPNGNPTNDPGNIWVDTIGATQFTVNVRNDPGVSGFGFGWTAELQ